MNPTPALPFPKGEGTGGVACNGAKNNTSKRGSSEMESLFLCVWLPFMVKVQVVCLHIHLRAEAYNYFPAITHIPANCLFIRLVGPPTYLLPARPDLSGSC
jgi:hypothetical protein